MKNDEDRLQKTSKKMTKRDIEKATEKMMKREYRKWLKNWWTVNTEKGLKCDEKRIQKIDRKRWREITQMGLKMMKRE